MNAKPYFCVPSQHESPRRPGTWRPAAWSALSVGLVLSLSGGLPAAPDDPPASAVSGSGSRHAAPDSWAGSADAVSEHDAKLEKLARWAERLGPDGPMGLTHQPVAPGVAYPPGLRTDYCPPDSLYAQTRPEPTDPWTAATSAGAYVRYESFSGVGYPICDVHWWGLALRYSGGWTDCTPASPQFQIKFYQDSGGLPGAQACTYTITASMVNTGLLYDAHPLYYFSTQLNPCCTLAGGWISIYGTDPTCWFLWMSSPVGDDLSYVWNGVAFTSYNFDLSFCLTANIAPGACCRDPSGVCTDNVVYTACPAHARFVSGVLCADIYPPCGDNLGACCNDATGVCTENVTYENCPPPLRFGPGLVCAQLDPVCGANLGACCNDDTGVCTDSVLYDNCPAPLRFAAQTTCAALDPVCGVNLGACCDDVTAVCNDSISLGSCPPPLRFAAGTPCADLDPGCGLTNGACCDDESATCTDGIDFENCPPTALFYGGQLCVDVQPPCGQGACCLGSGCLEMTPTDCAVVGGYDLGGGVSCAANGCASLPTTGVCCLPNGTCQPFSPNNCQTAGGTFHGYGATCADTNTNGTADVCESDCNANGVLDELDLSRGNSGDCNLNRTPDECDLASGQSRDCNTNGILDDCEPHFWQTTFPCLSGPGGGLPPGCACSDYDSDGDVDLRDFAVYQQQFKDFGHIYVSNGTGGGDWFDANTWAPPGIPGAVNHYDVVRIQAGDTVTQPAQTSHTLGYYLLEEGGTHVLQYPADVAALSVESYGHLTSNGTTNGTPPEWTDESDFAFIITIRNAAEVWVAGDVGIVRTYDPDYCTILENAPPPFDTLGPCRRVTTPRPEAPRFANQTTHRALTDVAVDNQACKVHDFLVNELLLPRGIDTSATDGATRTYKEWAVHGADQEDAPATRCANHFHNPINDAPIGFWGGVNNPTWAFNGNGNDWDFLSARDYYFNALTSAAANTRSQFTARTFRAVGQVMHLLEDMAVPDHTRHDQHPFSAPFEGWISNNYGTVAQMDALAAVTTVPPAAKPPRYTLTEPLPGFNRFINWWDTGQYTGQAAFAFGSTPGMAEFSNYNFFSRDTVFWFPNMPHPSYADTNILTLFPPPAGRPQVINPTNTDQTGAGWVNLAKTTPAAVGIVPVNPLARTRNLGINPVRNFFGFVLGPAPQRIEVSCVNNNVWGASAQLLLPKAMAYCTDFTNYFFRGKVDVRLTWDEGQQKYNMVITNKTGETLGAGTWRLYQDDASDNRAQITADFSGYGGSLANNASFNANFAATNRTGRYTLVFQGTIGNEANTGVVAKVFDIVRVHIIWEPKSDQDLYMRAPDGSLICYYNLSNDLGELDNDNIGGNGPENITLKRLTQEGTYAFMLNYYRDWWRERDYDYDLQQCVDNNPPLNSPDDEGYTCYTQTTITITVKTYHNSSAAVREVTRTLSRPNYGDNVPAQGTPEGAVGDSWFVTQIVTVDADGVVTIQGAP